MSKVGVIGAGGIVGSATVNGFTKLGCEMFVYDKYKDGGIGTINDVLNADYTFLCLPTLYSDELKQYDKSAIHEVLGQLSELEYKGLLILKSTVEPYTTAGLAEKYPNLRLVHNSEFLSSSTNMEDFFISNRKQIVVGYTKSREDGEELIKFYKTFFPETVYELCTSTETETMKIAVNDFYATKIQYFNELYFLCQRLNEKDNTSCDYANVKRMMIQNGWISEHHTKIAPDGKYGWGNVCFLKDTRALHAQLEREQLPRKVLGSAIEENDQIRELPLNKIMGTKW